MLNKIKRISIMCIAVILVLFSITACLNKTGDKEVVHKIADAKPVWYNTVDKMEAASDLIIVATKISEVDPYVEKNEGGIVIGYTLSDFKVKESIKTDEFTENGSVITVLENEFIDKENNTIYHIGGYQKMKENNEYLLFLKKSEDEDYYFPLANNLGTIPISMKENLLEPEDVDVRQPEIKALHEEIVVKYDSYFVK